VKWNITTKQNSQATALSAKRTCTTSQLRRICFGSCVAWAKTLAVSVVPLLDFSFSLGSFVGRAAARMPRLSQ
jgi:hypothetical protein